MDREDKSSQTSHRRDARRESLRRRHQKSAKDISSEWQLLDLATEAMLVRDLDGRVIYWSQGAERMYGWTKDQVLGQSAFDILRTAFPVPFDQIKEGLLRDGWWEGELSHTKKDGTKITVASRWTLQRDQEGKPVGWLQINNDITEQKRTREALRESEEGLRLLIDGVKDYAIFRLDSEGHIASWNAGAQRINGYLADEVIGKHFSIFYLPEDVASGKPARALSIAAQEGRFEEEGWRVRKDGSRFFASVSVSPLRDESENLRGFAKVTRDITERRAAEATQNDLQALELRSNEIRTLSQLGHMLHACMTEAEAFNVIREGAPQLFTTESGALYLMSPSRDVLETASVWGAPAHDEQVFPQADCWALRTGHPYYVNDSRSAMLCKHLNRWPTTSHLCVPMTAQADILGVLHISANPASPAGVQEMVPPIPASKQQLAMTFTEQVGLAIANVKLRETLKTQSIRDPLTGLFNRRYMQESLERELRRAARSERQLSAILLDIDHFKQYNDSYGHEIGDVVLRELSSLLLSQIRFEDIACRLGGEEFILILPETSLEVAQQRGEKLREAIRHLMIQSRGQLLGTITVSIGVSVFPMHGTTSAAFLQSADDALYRAKKEGRDRLVIANAISEMPSQDNKKAG
jgi:diguanylate cyclase (GGDEF)-like protein/PAS domain S-box-containing protein